MYMCVYIYTHTDTQAYTYGVCTRMYARTTQTNLGR